ncbi:MAG: hypothetical protein R3F54_28335 [Alphaproteobacteria bacterium]
MEPAAIAVASVRRSGSKATMPSWQCGHDGALIGVQPWSPGEHLAAAPTPPASSRQTRRHRSAGGKLQRHALDRRLEAALRPLVLEHRHGDLDPSGLTGRPAARQKLAGAFGMRLQIGLDQGPFLIGAEARSVDDRAHMLHRQRHVIGGAGHLRDEAGIGPGGVGDRLTDATAAALQQALQQQLVAADRHLVVEQVEVPPAPLAQSRLALRRGHPSPSVRDHCSTFSSMFPL